MEITVYNMEKKQVGRADWPDDLFGKFSSRGRIYQVVVQQMQNRRQGNANVLSRHEVAGSTRKIVRQKGTGGARHGDIKAPIFVGGGRAFGPKSRDWGTRIPQRIRQGAVRDLIRLKQQEEKFWLVKDLALSAPKTKEMALFFEKFGIHSGLLVLEKSDKNVEKSVRNLPSFRVAHAESLSALDLIRFDHLVMTEAAFAALRKKLS